MDFFYIFTRRPVLFSMKSPPHSATGILQCVSKTKSDFAVLQMASRKLLSLWMLCTVVCERVIAHVPTPTSSPTALFHAQMIAKSVSRLRGPPALLQAAVHCTTTEYPILPLRPDPLRDSSSNSHSAPFTVWTARGAHHERRDEPRRFWRG